MGERFLVTGAQGFLGRWICADLLTGSPAAELVVGVGRSARTDSTYTATVTLGGREVPAPLPASAQIMNGDPRYRYHPVDILDRGTLGGLLAEFRPDVVIHAAAALRDEAWGDLIEANVTGTAALLDALAAAPRTPRLVLVSSGSVYGPTDALPLQEGAHCQPADPYAVTKLAGEQVARVAARRGGIALSTARVFNLLGPGLQERHLPAALAAQLAAIAVGTAPPTLRVGTLSTTRDFIDVRDAAQAVGALARAAPLAGAQPVSSDSAGVVNVASGRETPIQDIVDGLLAATDARVRLPVLSWQQLPPRAADTPRVVAAVGRLAAVGALPHISIAASLDDMVAYYLGQSGASISTPDSRH